MKDTTPANTDQEKSRLAERLGEVLQGIEIPDPEGLAKEMEAAEKRVADYHRDGAEVRALERMYNNGQ